MSVKKLKSILGDAHGIPSDIAAIHDMFTAQNISCVETSTTPLPKAHSVIVPRSNSGGEGVLETLSNSPAKDIDLVVIETTITSPEIYKDTDFWNNRTDELFRNLMESDRPVDEARREHHKLAGAPLALNIFLFCQNGICFIYKRSSWQALIFSSYYEEEEEAGDLKRDLGHGQEYYGPEDESWSPEDDSALSDEEMQKEFDLADSMSQELARADGWGLCRNHDQRQYFAEKLFADRDNVYHFHLNHAIHKAKTIFEMEVLPEKVASLHKEGKSPKEIAAETGCSQAKTKRIIASIKEKSDVVG